MQELADGEHLAGDSLEFSGLGDRVYPDPSCYYGFRAILHTFGG